MVKRSLCKTSPDKYEVEVSESGTKGESRIDQLHKLLDEGKKQIHKGRNQKRKCGANSNPVVL